MVQGGEEVLLVLLVFFSFWYGDLVFFARVFKFFLWSFSGWEIREQNTCTSLKSYVGSLKLARP